MTDMPAIFLVDKNADICESLAGLFANLKVRVVHYPLAAQFFNNANQDCSGCVISDISATDLDAWEIMRRLNAARSPLAYIVVTRATDVPTAVALMEAGITTVMEIPYDEQLLRQRVERAVAASVELWRRRERVTEVQRRIDSLSREERSIMHMMLADEPNKAIAGALQISMRTVDRRRQTVLETMKIGSIPDLAILLCEVGLLPTRVVGHEET